VALIVALMVSGTLVILFNLHFGCFLHMRDNLLHERMM